VDVPTTFSRHGQWIILGLIQIGGLGVMTLTYFFAYFLAGGVSLRSRIALRDLLSEENLDHIGTVLGVVVGFTLLIELAGAFLIHLSLRGSGLPPGELVFFSLFHAISAFCNAGFSTLSAGLADARVVDRTGFLSIVMILIVVGGLGFPVLKNFWLVSYAHLTRWIRPARTQKPRLSTNSRIVLTTNAVLILGGALTIGLTEFYFGYGQRAGSAVFTSVFHSITARTAGFNVTATENLLPATAAVLMALMFVGGSPSSTAGGIKTTTLAVAFLSLRRIVTGRADIEAFGRRLEPQIADRALAIVLLSIAFILLVTVLLCTLHPELPPANLAFEAVSAVSTVGLTRGVTLQLGPAAKVVLVVAMLVGRVGVLLCVFSFLPPASSPGLSPAPNHRRAWLIPRPTTPSPMKCCIIGLGVFGRNLARCLSQLGADVLVVDRKDENISAIKDDVSAAVVMDFADPTPLESLPIAEMDVVVVAIGDKLRTPWPSP
jgi:trk system potassium uptake protein TrkH